MNSNIQLTRTLAFLKELKESIEKTGKGSTTKLAKQYKVPYIGNIPTALKALRYVEITDAVGATKIYLTTVDKSHAEQLLRKAKEINSSYPKHPKSNKESTAINTIVGFLNENFGKYAVENGCYQIGNIKIEGTFTIQKV